jgi:uncharacterized protein Veg
MGHAAARGPIPRGGKRLSEGVGTLTRGQDVLSDIRRRVEALVGQRVLVKANRGRRKVVEREGTVERTYASHFVILLDEDKQYRRVSYSYADLLTALVELSLCGQAGPQRLQFTAS